MPEVKLKLGRALRSLLHFCPFMKYESINGPVISKRINHIAKRYVAIMDSHGVDVTNDEILTISLYLRGRSLGPNEIRSLPDRFNDNGFGTPELIAKLNKASYADLLSLVEKIERRIVPGEM